MPNPQSSLEINGKYDAMSLAYALKTVPAAVFFVATLAINATRQPSGRHNKL
jgi:hypothetical protein